MPFSYKTRSRQYVDLSDVAPNDRIKVVLQSGCVVVLKKAEKPEGYTPALEVDRDLTCTLVLDSLYEHIIRHEREGVCFDGVFGWLEKRRHIRNIPSTDEIHKTAQLEIWVSAEGDAFDNSPRVGERLSVLATLPGRGGSGWSSSSIISEVEFYAL